MTVRISRLPKVGISELSRMPSTTRPAPPQRRRLLHNATTATAPRAIGWQNYRSPQAQDRMRTVGRGQRLQFFGFELHPERLHRIFELLQLSRADDGRRNARLLQ